MTQEEIKKFYDFERRKHFEFFLPYYQEKNWQVIEDNINKNYSIDWDIKLEVFSGKFILVDEKARQEDYGDCLVEIMQDMETGKLGWLYGKKDYILYASWVDVKNCYPSSFYLISSKELKNYIFSLIGRQVTIISKRGSGVTWNIKLDWSSLVNNKIAKKLL